VALARRASIVLFILGGLIALVGVLNTTGAFTFSSEDLMRQSQQMVPASQPTGGINLSPQLSPAQLKVGIGIAGGLEVLVGLGIMLLGSPVRRGRSWAVTTGIVVVCILGALCLLLLVTSLLVSIIAPAMAGMACVLIIPTTLCGLLLRWLIQVTKALRPVGGPYAGPPAVGWPAPTPPPTWQQQPAGPAVGPSSGYSPYAAPNPPAREQAVRYGYAQAPAIPEPPAGDAPVGGSAPTVSLPPASASDSGVADKSSRQG
jgi:hypothetical protein